MELRVFPPVAALFMALLGMLAILSLQAQGPATMTVVSGASFWGSELAPESIAAAFGQEFAPALTVAETTPLPVSLAGVTVTLRDSGNVDHPAGLVFVSRDQASFLVPREVRRGPATVTL